MACRYQSDFVLVGISQNSPCGHRQFKITSMYTSNLSKDSSHDLKEARTLVTCTQAKLSCVVSFPLMWVACSKDRKYNFYRWFVINKLLCECQDYTYAVKMENFISLCTIGERAGLFGSLSFMSLCIFCIQTCSSYLVLVHYSVKCSCKRIA